MASGHVNRTQRPNTWLRRPTLRREDSPCQLGAVHTWPFSTVVAGRCFGRYRGRNGHEVGAPETSFVTHLYGPAARCKPKMMIWRTLVLRFCIRPVDGAIELLAIMDIRARPISFASRPQRPYGSPDHERAGETFSPSPLSDSQTSAGSQHLFRDELEPSAIPLVILSVFRLLSS
jgi:hypothetical protein